MATDGVFKPLTLEPSTEPTALLLGNITSSIWRRKLREPEWYDEFATRYLHPDDRVDYFTCASRVARFRDDDTGKDQLSVERCRNGLWCPLCLQTEEYRRRRHWSALLDQAAADTMRGYKLVFHTPTFLRPLMRAPGAPAAFAAVIDRTIARSFGAHTYRAQREWWRRHGALWSFHPIGDKAEPWPLWAPHYDGILNGWEFDTKDRSHLAPMGPEWPCSFDETREHLRSSTRELMLPILKKHGSHAYGDGLIEAFYTIQGEFDVDFYLGHVNGTSRRILVGRELSARLDYPNRSFWYPFTASMQWDDAIGEHVIHYPGRRGSNAPVRHLPASYYVRSFNALRKYMHGKDRTHLRGYFAKKSYATVCRNLGIDQVNKKKRRYQFLGKYWRGPDGSYSAERFDSARS